MSLPAQNVAPQLTATPGQTVFPFAWRCDDAAVVRVWVNDVLDGGFAVALNADQTAAPGGTITRALACFGGEVVTVERTTPQTQLTSLAAYNPFPAATITSTLDRVVMLLQEVAAVAFNKCIRAARSSLLKLSSLELPAPVVNKVLGWADAGGGLFRLANIDQAPAGPVGPPGAGAAFSVAYMDINTGRGDLAKQIASGGTAQVTAYLHSKLLGADMALNAAAGSITINNPGTYLIRAGFEFKTISTDTWNGVVRGELRKAGLKVANMGRDVRDVTTLLDYEANGGGEIVLDLLAADVLSFWLNPGIYAGANTKFETVRFTVQRIA